MFMKQIREITLINKDLKTWANITTQNTRYYRIPVEALFYMRAETFLKFCHCWVTLTVKTLSEMHI